jgi:hypothetical protein
MIQFTRLLVLIKWSDKLEEVQTVQDLVMELARRDSLFKTGMDALIETVNTTQLLKMPLFDLPTSVDVLATREYRRLPSILEKTHVLMGTAPPRPKLKSEEVESTKARLNEMMRLRLMWSKIPENFEVPQVSDGAVVLKVADEFEATLTLLHGVTQTSPWTLIKLKFLVAPDVSYGDNYVTTEYNRRVEGIANAAMEADPRNPLAALYAVGHTFAQNLQLEILHSQAEVEKTSGSDALPQPSHTKQKVAVQGLVYSPGNSLELTFPGGFKLLFTANGPTTSPPSTSPSTLGLPSATSNQNTPGNAMAAGTKRRLRKSTRTKHGLGLAAAALNQTLKTRGTVASRGATLTLKEQRRKATKISVESVPAVLNPLTGDIVVYEVNTRAIDLEAIVSRAKRMYAHEQLQNLANMIRFHISASQELLRERIEAVGLEAILEATDQALETRWPVSNNTATPPNARKAPEDFSSRSHIILALSPDDVAVHINQGMLKSYISIRLFEHHVIMIHLGHSDGLPTISPGLGLSTSQLERIQKKLRSYESDASNSCIAEVIQELQRHAVTAALKKIGASCGLLSPHHPGLPSPTFAHYFGEHFVPFLFQDATLSQSRLVAVLDHLALASPSDPFAAPSGSANASMNTHGSLASSRSSISSLRPGAPADQVSNASSAINLQSANSATSQSALPSLASAYAPIRVRFVLLPAQTPETYTSRTAALLAIPEREVSHDEEGQSADEAVITANGAMEIDSTPAPSENGVGRGLKRNGNNQAVGVVGSSGSGAEGEENLQALNSGAATKKRKLEEALEVDGEVHRVRGEYDRGMVGRSGFVGVGGKDEEHGEKMVLSAEEVKRRSEKCLKRKMSSMEWHWVMEEMVRESGGLVTRVLLVEELERAQAQYKPHVVCL